jgi:hypothetical protein
MNTFQIQTFQQINVTQYHQPHRTARRTPSQLEKYNFSGDGKTTGQGDAIASKERGHFSSLVAILENRHVTLFH